MKAVAYIRVSTEEQHLGPEAQRSAIERWAKTQGIEVVSWREDKLSGATPIDKRPGLMAAVADVQLLKAGWLLASSRDRLARDVSIAAALEANVVELGAKLATADGVSIEDTPEAALHRVILDAFSQYERAKIRFRIKAAMAVKKRRGELVGSVPLGFRVITDACPRHAGDRNADCACKLVPDYESRLVHAQIREMKRHGETFRGIVRRLAEEGCGRWHLSQVQKIIAS
jgi:DNA invertase Pin-like site-specific DNA recombinase